MEWIVRYQRIIRIYSQARFKASTVILQSFALKTEKRKARSKPFPSACPVLEILFSEVDKAVTKAS